MSMFEAELDTVSGTYLEELDFMGGVSQVEFHYKLMKDWVQFSDGEEESSEVKIFAAMFGGAGSTTDIFKGLSDEQAQYYAGEIESAYDEEQRGYPVCPPSDFGYDDTLACTEHMERMQGLI